MDHVSGMKDSVWLGCHFYSNWSIDSMQSDSEYQQAFCVEITKIQNRKKWFLKNCSFLKNKVGELTYLISRLIIKLK